MMTATDATAELAFAGVAVQAELVRRGEVSSRELVELALDRIDTLDPELRAFVAVYPDRARVEADRADARRARGEAGALLGVPIAVKDEFDLEGEVTGRGTSAFNAPAAVDAEVIRRLRDAGAVLVGKTAMPELGLWPFTESLACGVTRNPWDHERTPGGSSGGSAAAVAAGLVPAALGVDGAGSIRIPAACCGLFGLKPQRDRVPRTPHDRDGSHWICFGTLTRTVRDTALMLDVLADPDAGGTWEDAARTPPGPLRIGVAATFPAGTRGRLSAEVAAAVQDTATLLSSLGHDVFEADTGFLVRDVPTTLGLLFRGVHEFVAEVQRPQRLERRTRALARPGALIGAGLLDRLPRAEQAMVARVLERFKQFDVLLTPVTSEPAVPAQLMEGRGATATFLWESSWVPFTVLWNQTGQPAASVPAGFTRDGLPLAVQLVGRPHSDRTLLALSAQLEEARPWATRRPPIEDIRA